MVTHKDLDIWKLGIELVEAIYKTTLNFPKEEIYGLTNQMRRAAISVPSNISEGAARGGKKEFIQFLYVALGSLSELETQLIISGKLGYTTDESLMELIEKLRRKQLNRRVPRKPHPLGRGQGAQYERELPYREAPPFRAGSFILSSTSRANRMYLRGGPLVAVLCYVSMYRRMHASTHSRINT